MYNKEFYEDIDLSISQLMNHPVPELILKENRKLNDLLKNQLDQKNTPNYNIEQNIITNILNLKGYKILKINNHSEYETLLEKDQSLSKFKIITDYSCDSNNPFVTLELILNNNLGHLLETDARFIGILLPFKNMVGFISKDKLQKTIKEKVIYYIRTKSKDDSLLTQEETSKLKKISILQSDLESMETHSIIMQFLDFIQSWQINDDKNYKIVSKDNEAISLLMPANEFLKEFKIVDF